MTIFRLRQTDHAAVRRGRAVTLVPACDGSRRSAPPRANRTRVIDAVSTLAVQVDSRPKTDLHEPP